MELSVRFAGLLFQETVLRRAVATVEHLPGGRGPGKFRILCTSKGDESWNFSEVEDFFASYTDSAESHLNYVFELKSKYWDCSLTVVSHSKGSTVTVKSELLTEINAVMNVFRASKEQAIKITWQNPPEDTPDQPVFNIFIGHGRSNAWQDLSNHLRDKHELNVVSYESGARAGHTIRDILEEMLDASSIAFLVHTAEDETADEKFRARQNVVHETGLFQGRLGFSKAVVLMEEGVEGFSNLAGIQYIPFQKGHINGTFGEVLATIRREQKRYSR
jgi:predicted nucleotide-binding protein